MVHCFDKAMCRIYLKYDFTIVELKFIFQENTWNLKGLRLAVENTIWSVSSTDPATNSQKSFVIVRVSYLVVATTIVVLWMANLCYWLSLLAAAHAPQTTALWFTALVLWRGTIVGITASTITQSARLTLVEGYLGYCAAKLTGINNSSCGTICWYITFLIFVRLRL